MQETIKGQCEHCGFTFEGKVTLVHGVFPVVECPKCWLETENFDSAYTVDRLNQVEKTQLSYSQVSFA